MINALTVDLEDWYHGLTRTMRTPERWPLLPSRVNEATALLLDLLGQANVKATFFVMGDIARGLPRLVAQIAQAGHEVASHGDSHRLVHQMTPDEFRKNLDDSREVIQQAAGKSVRGFRSPQFSIDQRCLWAFRVLEDAGYAFDSSVFPAKSWLYGYAGAPRSPYRPLADGRLMEYPIATARLGAFTLPVAGGVYTRFVPYPLIRWALSRLNAQGIPAVLYLHPWELDLAQPRIPVNLRERFSHYGRRASLASKLARMLQDFHFAPLGEIHRTWQLPR